MEQDILLNDKLKEECGIFGIFSTSGADVATNTFYALVSLQHRGQESCGIAVNQDREIYKYKNLGLVNEVFDEKVLDGLKGTMAVGHVRYGTAADRTIENSQPLVLHYKKGNLAIAHNGNILNGAELRNEFNQSGAIYQTTSDAELIAYTVARERINCGSIQEAISRSMQKLRGAYSLLIMSPQKLIAAKDPWGFRPLCMGRLNGDYVFASESCAFDTIGATFERELEPGEIVVVEKGVATSNKENCKGTSGICVFEYIYFARPDSIIFDQEVYESRKLAGRILARRHPVEADVVIGVPDSGIGAAIGYGMESKIPYEDGFVKSKYVGRTFIKPRQSERETAVKLKLNALKSTVAGKRVIMVDDSIVRGTTSARIVKQLREAGAAEVHVRISSPPFLYRCYYGTDIPSRDELVSAKMSNEEIRKLIDADSLGYLELGDLKDIVPNVNRGFCAACFDGKYYSE